MLLSWVFKNKVLFFFFISTIRMPFRFATFISTYRIYILPSSCYITRSKISGKYFKWTYAIKYSSGFYIQNYDVWFNFFLLGLIPLSFIIAFAGLEICIAFIQSQVFVVLSCLYIKDGLDLH